MPFNEIDKTTYAIEEPIHSNGLWSTRVTLNQRTSELFQGETREDVQEKILQYLGRQALEIEKLRIQLRKTFESQSASNDAE